MSGPQLDRQLLREVEGYLDLAYSAEGQRDLPLAMRTQLADRCIALLDRLTVKMGARVHALMLRGHALKMAESYAPAIEIFERCAGMDDENIHIFLALAWCHKRNGHVELAIQALEEALLIDDSEPILYYNLACYWAIVKDMDLTVQYLARALDLDAELRELVADEPDFDSVRHDPRFQTLTSVIV